MSKTSRWLAYGLFVLAAGLVANTLLGPLFTGTIQYHYGETLTNQGMPLTQSLFLLRCRSRSPRLC